MRNALWQRELLLGSIFRIAYKKDPCFNCPKVINCGAVIGSCVSKSVQFKKIDKAVQKNVSKKD